MLALEHIGFGVELGLGLDNIIWTEGMVETHVDCWRRGGDRKEEGCREHCGPFGVAPDQSAVLLCVRVLWCCVLVCCRVAPDQSVVPYSDQSVVPYPDQSVVHYPRSERVLSEHMPASFSPYWVIVRVS